MSDEGAVKGSGVTERAVELRATLSARQEAEAILAEASQIRRSAAADADTIVEEAQNLAEQLEVEARQTAERLTSNAEERSADILADARQEATEITDKALVAADATRQKAEDDAEDLRNQYRAEIAEEHRQGLIAIRQESDALIGGLETSVDGIGSKLDAAVSSVADVLRTLSELRVNAVDALPDPGEAPVPPVKVDRDRGDSSTPPPAAPGSWQSASLGADEAAATVETPEAAAPAAPAPAPARAGAAQPGKVGSAAASREADADEETLAVMPATERKQGEGAEPEGSRPLGWLFRAPQ